MSGNHNLLRRCLGVAVAFLRGCAKAAWNHGWLRDPIDIGAAEGSARPEPVKEPRLIFPNAPRVPVGKVVFDTPPRPAGRAMFPAPAWSVPADGPNEPGPGLAEQLAGKLVDYEWNVLRDADGQVVDPHIMSGAAFNEATAYLKKMGLLSLMCLPTQLGKAVLALDPKRVDVV